MVGDDVVMVYEQEIEFLRWNLINFLIIDGNWVFKEFFIEKINIIQMKKILSLSIGLVS